jgi:hypothetical protein
MRALNVMSTETKICDPGNRDAVHIYNNSDSTIYIGYDGDTNVDGTRKVVTTAIGMPIVAGGLLMLSNDTNRNLAIHAIYAIAFADNKEVRIQGA